MDLLTDYLRATSMKEKKKAKERWARQRWTI